MYYAGQIHGTHGTTARAHAKETQKARRIRKNAQKRLNIGTIRKCI